MKIRVWQHRGDMSEYWTPINETWTWDDTFTDMELNVRKDDSEKDGVEVSYAFSELPTDVQTFYALKVLSK